MLAAEEEEEMNNYDRFLVVREKLRLVHEAGYAVDRLRTKGSFSTSSARCPSRAWSFCP